MDLTQVLPEEILADVLRRVAPRGLAVCRCACKALLAVIDARRLLRGDLLPLSVGGVFINFYCERVSEFFASPSTGPTISGRFDFHPYWIMIALFLAHGSYKILTIMGISKRERISLKVAKIQNTWNT
ncbi:uncharacterized protein LOC125540843 [Triticum urartu]|uniref:uncharacterized protein LOC125528646 n=1 Tax=Triticum urartu TaxID=4572 RepID=UPI002044BE63|nr:uncharacterized protein LOC125528646 [Triticum urartu]XP_048560344.1 uncharacterized protein LOC125540843 [Triticum urartu]